MGYKELGLKEQELMSFTPKKYCALMDCAAEFNERKYSGLSGKNSQSVKSGYIEDLVW